MHIRMSSTSLDKYIKTLHSPQIGEKALTQKGAIVGPFEEIKESNMMEAPMNHDGVKRKWTKQGWYIPNLLLEPERDMGPYKNDLLKNYDEPTLE